MQNRYDGLRNKKYSDALKSRDTIRHSLPVTNTHSTIPVFVSSRSEKRLASRRDHYTRDYHPDNIQDDDDDYDDDFETHIRRRSMRFYIDGFQPSYLK